MQKYLEIDSAVEEGNMEDTRKLIAEGITPSLYAVQMAFINGHFSTGNFVLGQCSKLDTGFRNNVDVKTLHYNYKTKSWSETIPVTYRY